MDAEKKRPGFEKRITMEVLVVMRQKFLALPKDMSHWDRGAALASEFTQFTTNTLEDYSRISIQVCQEVFDRAVAGEISITALAEFAGAWDWETQKYIAKEYVDQKLSLKHLRLIKQLKREHGTMGYSEAIARAKGEIPIDQPRKEQKTSLDQLLTQIADQGARWRAKVTMALEMVRDEEAASGIHETIFEKVFILRQLVGEQYDFINSRVQRYMNVIRKKVKEHNQQAAGLDQSEMVPPDGTEPKVIDAEFSTRPREDGAGPSSAQEQ